MARKRSSKSRAARGAETRAGELTPVERRDLDRRLRDIDDPVRYALRDRLLPGVKLELFYDLTNDVWVTDLADATLFKRRAAAAAISQLLGGSVRILRVAKPPRAPRRAPRAGARARAKKA